MTTAAERPRHGSLAEFLSATDGMSVATIAEILRCCSRSVRNWIAGRSPIPWHRIELLRLRAADAAAAIDAPAPHVAEPAPEPPVVPTLESDPDAPDVTPADMLAWVGVHAPQYLSSARSFAAYVRGWNVIDKIRRARAAGEFTAVLARWRTLAIELPRAWRTGPIFSGIGPPAYRKITS
ncbi:IS21 family transposase [Burkholderia plantarii]|uniref:IS21 family transposase n=1 Tax=Burkholderia plantarii TaxID=41899 RepID=UPI00272A9A73|nr:IS21 family transposase [Burkholderia plantarii]WLE59291.1 IS21 family transposase [Burkholderia plantarii]